MRQQVRQQRDLMRQQMRQQRESFRWQRRERESAENRPNWGQIRRLQAFETRRQRRAERDDDDDDDDSNGNSWRFARRRDRGDRDFWKFERRQEERAERDYWRFARRQHRFENRAGRLAEQFFYNTQPTYSYRAQPDVWFGDDYSDYNRYSRYTVYTPTYRSYDYVYNDYPINSPYVYDDDSYYDTNDGFDWKTLLFRSLISAFFANGNNVGYFSPTPQYGSFYDNNYYGYIPQYRYQPPYYTFGAAPNYAYYEPAAYYGYDQFVNYGVPVDYIAYDSLPYNDMVDIYSGGVTAELIQRALGTGYYQGLLEGQMARDLGWGDENYYDPYLYQQAIYDPYSSSIGDCRRYMSEGYELGYQDALAGRDDLDLGGLGGDIDLVSMLLGSVLSFRG